jgi:hypothetical protein
MKKEKRTKKERVKGGGRAWTLPKGPCLFPSIINNRTSLTAYQEDLFNCPGQKQGSENTARPFWP